MKAGPIAVLGPGGVGGLVAAALQRSGAPVLVVAREETAAIIAEQGLRVQSARYGDFTVGLPVVAQLHEPVAALIVTTKAPGLDDALDRVHCEPPLVLPLLNGLDHLAHLREVYMTADGLPERVLAGSVRVQTERPRPGVVSHATRMLRVEMACADPASRPMMLWLHDRLAGAGIDVFVLDSEAQVMWSKLVRLNAIACATSAYDLPLGGIRADASIYAELVDAAHEGSRVAAAEGADVPAEVILGEIAELPDDATTSMRRDIADGQPPEFDAIPGAVLRAAVRHGVDCPAITRLVAAIVERTGLATPIVQ